MTNQKGITLIGGAQVLINSDAPFIKCRGCGAMIKFAKTLTESYLPIEPVDIDGITFWQAHFATCPQAGKFRKKIKRSEKTN